MPEPRFSFVAKISFFLMLLVSRLDPDGAAYGWRPLLPVGDIWGSLYGLRRAGSPKRIEVCEKFLSTGRSVLVRALRILLLLYRSLSLLCSSLIRITSSNRL